MRDDIVFRAIKNILGTSNFKEIEQIQRLWSGYGAIARYLIENQTYIIKHICPEQGADHPRGWNTNLSHQRKLKSYEVETYWYQNYLDDSNGFRCPTFLGSYSESNNRVVILEDLDQVGYYLRKSELNLNEIKACIKWLANFHAKYINNSGKGLWPVGTYWHLETRPDEWNAMESGILKDKAGEIDQLLNSCKFKTLVHGDAKVANFCFHEDNRNVAALDFQYIGKGCGIKDVMYFMSSCLYEDECENLESELLDYYFEQLTMALPNDVNAQELENEWRTLYPVAWTDFYRFLLGWMPTHYKINRYVKTKAEQTIALLSN